MKDVFRQILTQADNLTFSTPRMVALVIVATFIGLTIADFVVNRKFDGQAFGTGASMMVAAVGAAIALGEPKAT